MLNKIKFYYTILALCSTFWVENACSMNLFLEAFEVKQSAEPGKVVFATITHGDQTLQYSLIADPSYDQTFKKIFSWDNSVLGVTGQERIMSILNSIFYPDVGDAGEKIREVTALPNEHTKLDEKTPLGVLKFDVACRCSCWAEGRRHSVKIFDIEMQTGYEAEFAGRLFDYGSVLRSANEHRPVIILAFLNYVRGGQDESSWLGLFYRDIKTGAPTTPVEGVIDTHCVDLSRKATMLKANALIEIGGKKLGAPGREWLKLLSMRHWATQNGAGRYIIPKMLASDPAINSALTILEQVTEEELKIYMVQESAAQAMLRGAKEDGIVEGIAQGVAQGALQEKIKTVKRMLEFKCSSEQIAAAIGMSEADLTELMKSPAYNSVI